MCKIIKNKNINFKYFIIKTYNAGIILKGWEIKPIKIKNEIQIKNSYIIINNKEIFLKESYINKKNNINESKRDRKLLLKNKEIKNIFYLTQKNNYVIIPLNFFLKNNIIKIKIAIALKKKINNKLKF